jgi:adenylate cyclase
LTFGAAYLGVTIVAFTRSGLWLPLFFPLAVATPLGYACAAGYKLVDYKRDRATLRKILNQFVPPDVVDVLARNASDIGKVKETTNVACVMTDVEGFTTLSQTLEPAQVSVLLAQYFEAIFKPVADHGGFICDLKGDSILALWIDRNSDPAVRAKVCDACLELRDAVDRFNDAHPDSKLPTRIGIHYGVVVLGAVGAYPHFEYRAVGDTVNTSSRVEQLSKELGTRVLATATMMEGLDQFLLRDLGDFPLRGRKAETRILELVARADDPVPSRFALCSRFALAKSALDAGDMPRAHAEFRSILADFPGDGPSDYFLRLTERAT